MAVHNNRLVYGTDYGEIKFLDDHTTLFEGDLPIDDLEFHEDLAFVCGREDEKLFIKGYLRDLVQEKTPMIKAGVFSLTFSNGNLWYCGNGLHKCDGVDVRSGEHMILSPDHNLITAIESVPKDWYKDNF